MVLVVVVVVVLLVVLGGSSQPAGYDVSYPQCSGSYPTNLLFGVVGVNGGLAHDANPCLGGELRSPTVHRARKVWREPGLS